jgi:hypothetical protein
VALSGCNKARSPEDPDSEEPVPLEVLESRLPGKWLGRCVPGAGNTFRQSELQFESAEHKMISQLNVWATAECQPPKLLSYRFNGNYQIDKNNELPKQPWVLGGELKTAFIALHREDLVKAANRAPGLYGATQWILDTEMPFGERVAPTFLAGLSRDVFPKGERIRVAGDRLMLGENSAQRLEYSSSAP